jgi:hypothetical protein
VTRELTFEIALMLLPFGGVDLGPAQLLGGANARDAGRADFLPLPNGFGFGRFGFNGFRRGRSLTAAKLIQFSSQFLNLFKDRGRMS